MLAASHPDPAVMPANTHPRVVTLGPAGTFSDEAAHVVMGPDSIIDYRRTFPQTLAELHDDADAVAVVPIENSVAGIVEQVQDMLVARQLVIVGEINVRVRYALLGNVAPGEARTCYAHPQANGQTLAYANRNLPDAQVAFTNSNVESGNAFLAAHERGEPALAVVPVTFAERHPQHVVATDIQDYTNNTTRFVVVRRRPVDYLPDLGLLKCSVHVEFAEDRPGLLYELLSIFHAHDINLSRLESRPSKTTPWFYVFYVDFTNNEHTAACLADLERSPFSFTFLGSYDRLA